MRLVVSSIVLAALAANPCFAKDGHARHGARASAANTGASGKGATGANPAPNKTNVPIDAGETVAPPVLPPRGVTRHQVRIVNPGAKIPANASRSQPGNMMSTAPAVRNAIGQPVVAPRNFVGPSPPVPLRVPGAVSPVPGGAAAPAVVSPGTARANVANATNRGNVNGATVIRPATTSVIGGPAEHRYGINGTTVQNRIKGY